MPGETLLRFKELEELLTRPLRGRDEELGALFIIEGTL